MARSRRNDSQAEKADQAEAGKKARLFRLEFNFWQFFLCSFGLFLILAWMFIFGVLVGRGLPLVDPDEASLRADLIRFIGLGRQTPAPPDDVAETWEDPKKMLESLDYYQSLVKRSEETSSKPSPPASAPGPVKAPTPSEPSSEPVNEKRKPSSTPPGIQTPAARPPVFEPGKTSEPAKAAEPEKTPAQARPQVTSRTVLQDGGQAESSAERFTLMAASLKESENARRLLDDLRVKGYSARMQTIDLAERGRWNRVLVGSFASREEAVRFAAEFNRKERKQALVIREGR